MNETMTEIFGDVISSYGRAQAIEDGVLVDLMQPETVGAVKEAGFRYPVAMTVAAFSDAICPIDEDLPPGQDIQGRLWDVLMLLKHAIRTHRTEPGGRLDFTVTVSSERVDLVSVCGPGDHGEPVLTIMLPNED